jgi:hypothetical protein
LRPTTVQKIASIASWQLLRTFTARDLSRSAARCPGDGRVIDTDYSAAAGAHWY